MIAKNFLLVLLLSIMSVVAAPAPMGIAINPDTMECGGYWPGDEYVSYRLPQGWNSYFPENDVIDTKFGSCSFRKDVGDSPGEEELCCAALGLKFVSSDVGTAGLLSSPFVNFLIVGSAVLVVFFVCVVLLFKFIRKLLKR